MSADVSTMQSVIVKSRRERSCRKIRAALCFDSGAHYTNTLVVDDDGGAAVAMMTLALKQ